MVDVDSLLLRVATNSAKGVTTIIAARAAPAPRVPGSNNSARVSGIFKPSQPELNPLRACYERQPWIAAAMALKSQLAPSESSTAIHHHPLP